MSPNDTRLPEQLEVTQINIPPYKILKFPNPMLKQKCEAIPIDSLSQDSILFYQEMGCNMLKSLPRTGLALAANQVGILSRIIVLRKDKTIMFNPKIIWSSDKKINLEESCLSMPNLYEKIKRNAQVTVEYYDENFQLVEDLFTDLDAVVMQHEIDHLNGKTMFDRLGVRKNRILSRYLKKGK